MVRIEDLIIEWQNKVIDVWKGGYKYGQDFNILRAIMEHRKDKVLVKNLTESIEDKTLKGKVESWMKSSPAKTLMEAQKNG